MCLTSLSDAAPLALAAVILSISRAWSSVILPAERARPTAAAPRAAAAPPTMNMRLLVPFPFPSGVAAGIVLLAHAGYLLRPVGFGRTERNGGTRPKAG